MSKAEEVSKNSEELLLFLWDKDAIDEDHPANGEEIAKVLRWDDKTFWEIVERLCERGLVAGQWELGELADVEVWLTPVGLDKAEEAADRRRAGPGGGGRSHLDVARGIGDYKAE